MEDLPNVIQPAHGKQGLEQMLFTHAVPQEAGVVTGMHIANVGDIGRIINPQLSGVQVKWQNGITIKQKGCFAYL